MPNPSPESVGECRTLSTEGTAPSSTTEGTRWYPGRRTLGDVGDATKVELDPIE